METQIYTITSNNLLEAVIAADKGEQCSINAIHKLLNKAWQYTSLICRYQVHHNINEFTQLANNGNVYACIILGQYFIDCAYDERGLNYKQYQTKGIELIKQASNNGYIYATYLLGKHAYECGDYMESCDYLMNAYAKGVLIAKHFIMQHKKLFALYMDAITEQHTKDIICLKEEIQKLKEKQ